MHKKASILFIDHAAVLGGAELSLLDIARHFGERSRVALLSDGPFRELLEQAGVRVDVVQATATLLNTRREAGPVAALLSAGGLGRLIARLRPLARQADVLYANSQKAFVIAACLGMLTRRPVIWHLRDVLDADHFSRFNRLITTRLAACCGARVIANSHATRQAFIAAGGREQAVVTIHNGIAPTALDAVGEAQATEHRRSLGIGEGALVVGSFSRLAPWKGQHILIDAIAKTPDVHVLLVGDALFGETDYRDQLQHQIDRLNVGDRVHLLGFRRDVPVLMKSCDVVVHSSVAPEPFGRVIVEGMLAGRPVIASRAGGALEIITRPEHGLLVEPGDPDALVAAISQLQRDPALRRRLAEHGCAWARSAFSIEAMIEKIEQQIDALLQGRPRQTPMMGTEAGSRENPDRLSTLPSDSGPGVLSAIQHGSSGSADR